MAIGPSGQPPMMPPPGVPPMPPGATGAPPMLGPGPLGLGVPSGPPALPDPTAVVGAMRPTASKIQRVPPDVPESRKAAVSKLLSEVKMDEAHWGPDFKQMREDANFARGWQWPDQTTWDDNRYIANITQRHINQRVAALYAKDPTFVCRRRPRLDFQVWDGNPQSIMQAQQTMVVAQQVAMADPAAVVTAMPQQMQAVQQAQALL